MSNHDSSTPQDKINAIEITLWGKYGENGLTTTTRSHGKKIEDLYKRNEDTRAYIASQNAKINRRIDDRFSTLYLILGAGATGIIGALIGLIAALLSGAG